MLKIVVTSAILFSVAVTTGTAASKHRRPPHARAPVYNATGGVPSGISLSTACKPTDSPCRTQPDTW
jgi:hypothetical protein